MRDGIDTRVDLWCSDPGALEELAKEKLTQGGW